MATLEMKKITPPEGFRLAGWLYMNDDGIGPFFSGLEQGRYLNEWPVFERSPSDGHVCKRNGTGYGVCRSCELLDSAPNAGLGVGFKGAMR